MVIYGLRDLLKIIGYNDPKDAIKHLNLDHKYIIKYKDIMRKGINFPRPK